MSAIKLPEDSRRWAVWICKLERQIAEQADYIIGTSIRHPACDIRAARRATELATARRAVLDMHPEITQEVINEVHQILAPDIGHQYL